MRVKSKVIQKLIEAAEASGIGREELLEGLEAAGFSGPHAEVEWHEFVTLLERVSVLRGGDTDRIRDVGRKMTRTPSFAFLQRLARTMSSPRRLYEAGERWVAPSSFPEFSLTSQLLSATRLRMRGRIPEPHAPSDVFFHICEGVFLELPVLLGLPPATIHRSSVTPRTMDLVLDLPRSPSVVARIERAFRAVLHLRETFDLLEGQRQELVERLASVHRATLEIQALFDGVPDLVMIHRDGTILWNNRATVKTLGYEGNEDLVGTSLLDLVDPDSRALVYQRMRGIEEGKAPELIEVWVLTRDGTRLLVELAASQAVIFGGQPARLVVGRDVTERVRMQKQLLIADRMGAIGMLAAGVAHEVNNPLAYVLNNIEIAMKSLAPLGDAAVQGREALAVALEGVDHIRTIVRDLLLLARSDDGSTGLVDVRAVVDSTLALAANKVAERAELCRDYRAAPLVRGTEARLGQVLLNLVANALEAMPPGARATNELRVIIRDAADGRVVLEVADNGIGITPEHAARVFDPFFTTKALGRGTGLGLSISQRLATELGGELSFESTPNRGTTFRLTLPAAEPPASTGERPEER